MRVDIRQVSPLGKRMIRFLVSISFMFFWFTRNDRWHCTKPSPNSFASSFSVFDKGIIIRHLKNGANLHETAAIGETQSGGFFCDMAGVYWGPPCFGYQGGPQQTPAIPPAKSNYRAVTSRHFVPKLSLSPRIFA